MGIFRKTEQDIKKDIEKRIKKLLKAGKNKEVKEFRDFQEKEDLRDAFFNKLFMIGYSSGAKRKKLIQEAKVIATKLPDLKGWPKNKTQFWNIESYGWLGRIPAKIRVAIKKELKKLKGKNLSLGSGNYPYVEDSVLVDFSEAMLKSLEGKKILYNLEQKGLPFKDSSFDSVTMVFVVDYLKNLKNLLKEIKRVLKDNGKLIIVNSKKPIDDFYRTQEVKHLVKSDFIKLLKDFKIKIKEKKIDNKVLLFVEGKVYK